MAPRYPGWTACGARSADAAIIGGGFTGLSAALHLAGQGCDVALLEARDAGWGASGRNGGQVNPGLKLDLRELQEVYGESTGAEAYDTGAGAPDFLFSLVRRHGIECEARQSGTLRLAQDRLVMGGRPSFSLREDRAADYSVMRRVVAGLYRNWRIPASTTPGPGASPSRWTICRTCGKRRRACMPPWAITGAA
ncbi:MAG: oxidoreductase [Roseomonas sp.]|nr:oxidoreductase [Roseomonas sp.]